MVKYFLSAFGIFCDEAGWSVVPFKAQPRQSDKLVQIEVIVKFVRQNIFKFSVHEDEDLIKNA